MAGELVAVLNHAVIVPACVCAAAHKLDRVGKAHRFGFHGFTINGFHANVKHAFAVAHIARLDGKRLYLCGNVYHAFAFGFCNGCINAVCKRFTGGGDL